MTAVRALLHLPVVAGLGSWALTAQAQSASIGASTRSDDLATREATATLGDSPDALPGLVRVGVAGFAAPRATAAAHVGYGFTEPQNDEANAHHRLGASAAVAVAPWSFAALGVRADFRHDIHGSDVRGSDGGSLLDLTPLVRVGTMLPSHVHLGVDGRLRFAGATAGSGNATPELDARGLVAYSGLVTWLFAMHAGYRTGHRGGIVEDSSNMRPGDRIALGISQFDAILVGLGAVKTVENTEFFGEVSADVLVGSEAPGFGTAPLRISAGVRHPLARNLWLSGIIEGTPMGRAPSLPGDPLVPIEPRVQGLVGVVWRFLSPKKPVVSEPIEVAEKVEEEPKEEPVTEAPPPVVTSSVRITVSDKTGHPISDAKVAVDVPKRGDTPAQTLEVPLESTNVYVQDGIPVGDVEVVVTADLLKPHTQSVVVTEGAPAEITVTLLPAATVGSQLRGLVRSYSGTGVTASVTVQPGGHSARCNEEGVFELDLPPGQYKVIIEAEGYRSQNRVLRVRKEGVTVLNADLQEAAR